MKMKKTLISVALVASAFASTPALADFIPFTVHDEVVSGAEAIGQTYQAGKLSGNYTEYIGVTGAGSTPGSFAFSASAIGIFSSYTDVQGHSGPGTTVENSLLGGPKIFTPSYTIYAIFTASGEGSGLNFTGSSGHVEFWLDADQNTTFNSYDYLTKATVSGGGSDDKLIGSSDIGYGSGDLTAAPGAFNLFFKDFTLTPYGETYWTGITTVNFLLQSNGDFDQQTPLNPPNAFPIRVSGDFSANFAVPEPASLALVGIGLFGVGVAARRRKNQA